MRNSHRGTSEAKYQGRCWSWGVVQSSRWKLIKREDLAVNMIEYVQMMKSWTMFLYTILEGILDSFCITWIKASTWPNVMPERLTSGFFSASNAGALPVAISKDQRFRAWSEAKLWKHQDINLSSFNSWCCTKCATNNFIYQKEEIYLQTKTTLQPSLHLFGGIAFLRKAGIGTHSSPPQADQRSWTWSAKTGSATAEDQAPWWEKWSLHFSWPLYPFNSKKRLWVKGTSVVKRSHFYLYSVVTQP